MRLKKRVLSLLLIACLVVGLMPTAAFAAGTDTGKAIQLVDSGTAANIGGGQADSIYFGTYQQSSDGNNGYNNDPIKWRVLSNAGGKLFLISDQNLDVFEYHKENESVTWETSTLRSWLNGLANNKGNGENAIDYTNDNFLDTAFSAKEQAAIADTNVVNDDNPLSQTEGGNNTTDKVFLLSLAETENTNYFAEDYGRSHQATNTAYVADGGKIEGSTMAAGAADFWWLRSPGEIAYYAAFVSFTGGLNGFGYNVDTIICTVRPAFNLNLSSVLFTSAANNSGHIRFGTTISDYSGNEWKATLKDGNNFSNGASVSGTTALVYGYSDTTLKINHAALSTLSADYTNVTAMLTNSSGNILYYGSINETTSATESTVTIPAGLAAGEYTLSVYGEDWNGANYTDYATGTPYTIKITVHGHSFTVETVKDEAFKSAANCTTPATYYKSCECGAVSTSDTDTFTDGDPLGHSWATAWNSDSTHHWHECQNSNCPVTDNSGKNGYTEHTPDAAATETTAQICTVCEYEINPALGHTYGAEWKFDSTHHWYECSCGAKSEVSTHNHDNDKDAICDTCGYVRVLAANPIEITRQPTDSLILEGQRAEFSVEAIGDGLTYQWYINRNDGRGWREIHGAVAAVHVPSVTDLDCEGFRYECMITDQYDNTLKSDEAVLHVSAVPPKTGDNSNHMLWMAMGLLSMAGILLLRRKAFAG